MTRFKIHSIDDAPDAESRQYLQRVNDARGYVTNLHGMLAESSLALKAYYELNERFAGSRFSDAERQVVMMTVNRLNLAPYCMAGHSARLESMGMAADQVEALRVGQPLSDARLEALRRFTEAVLYTRGRVNPATWANFEAAGYGEQDALEVLVGVALKTFSNFASRMTEAPLDAVIQHCAWSGPTGDSAPAAAAQASTGG